MNTEIGKQGGKEGAAEKPYMVVTVTARLVSAVIEHPERGCLTAAEPYGVAVEATNRSVALVRIGLWGGRHGVTGFEMI